MAADYTYGIANPGQTTNSGLSGILPLLMYAMGYDGNSDDITHVLPKLEALLNLQNLVPNGTNQFIANAMSSQAQNDTMEKDLGFSKGDMSYYDPQKNPWTMSTIQGGERRLADALAKAKSFYQKKHKNESSLPMQMPTWGQDPNAPWWQNLREVEGMMKSEGAPASVTNYGEGAY